MRQLALAFALIVPFGLTLAGCDKGDDHGHDHDHGDHSHDDGHDHGAEAGGGDHAAEHGKEHKIGPISVGDYTVNIVSYGELEPGTGGHFDIVITGGDVAAVRLWAGDEQATGVAKDKAGREDEPGKFHGHADIPDPIGDAKLWIEIESPDGKRIAGSAPIEHDHAHEETPAKN